MLKKYEGLFIFTASLKDEAQEKVFAIIQSEVEKQGGKILNSERMGVRTFARPMKKKDAGLYFRLQLEMDPLKVSPLVARFKLNEDIFRVQITSGISKKKEEAAVATAGKDKEDGELQ